MIIQYEFGVRVYIQIEFHVLYMYVIQISLSKSSLRDLRQLSDSGNQLT